MTKRVRVKANGFIGIQLDPALLKRLDAKVKELKDTAGFGNRTVVIRMAIIEYLK